MTEAQPAPEGLKQNAIGYLSNIVIGVASTAPGYSIAATLGFVVAIEGVGLQAPAVMLIAFLPMFCIAYAYRYMNQADPDCGTTFSWATRGLGPSWGWLGGWAIVATDVIVMASLSQIAAIYTFLLFDWNSAADSHLAVMIAGVLWIFLMTLICYLGTELSARTQQWLLGIEIATLTLFAVWASRRSTSTTRPARCTSPPAGLTPSRSTTSARLRRECCSARSSTGAGTAGWPSTRSPRTKPTDPARRR